jgi:hypothetical protein
MKRNFLLPALLILSFLFSCKTEKQPPNFVFILVDDLGEETDISEKFSGKVEELKAVLNKKLNETCAKFPQPNPNYVAGD